MNSIGEEKKRIRLLMREKRAALSEKERGALSCNMVKNVLSWDIYRSAENVLIYYPVKGEIDLLGLALNAPQKKLFLPITKDGFEMGCGLLSKGLKRGRYGILEPETELVNGEKLIDLVIAPAVACDRFGGRLGQGGGYYDRFLQKLRMENKNAVAAAAVYDFQIVGRLPLDEQDHIMDYVITPKRVYAVD